MPQLLVRNQAFPDVASISNSVVSRKYKAPHPFGNLQKLPLGFSPPCP